jgi:hypothetical protein
VTVGVAGVDLFVGEMELTGRGFGSEALVDPDDHNRLHSLVRLDR